MLSKYKILLNSFLLFVATNCCGQIVKPHPRQVEWQKLETTAFIHFTVNTYTDKEWGDGTESPSIFNPTSFDAKQIIQSIKDGGLKMAIITAKHHDGFCLWPSRYTNHSVASSPWKNGKGDLVKEIADACHEAGIKFGVYLSPWDMHEKTYGTDQYNNFYKNQLTELLTNYGSISEVWFDGAKGENQKDMEYDFKGYWEIVRKLQPNAVIFSDIGLDARWVGNEKGIANDPCWSTMDPKEMLPGKADAKYLNIGDPDGKKWMPAEADVSIRPGWFYHSSEDSKVKTGKELVDLYYQSVGRNAQLLLNIPPNRNGLIANEDRSSLKEFKRILHETFKLNYAEGRVVKSLTDQELSSYVSIQQGKSILVDFNKNVSIDRALFQENIANGQLNREAVLEYWDGSKWRILSQITSIGYKRLLRFPTISTTKVRLKILKSKQPVQLSEIGFFKASISE